MQKPVEIFHHGFEPSESLDDHIRKQAKRLEKYHDRIVGCRVTMEQVNKATTHSSWKVTVDVTLPPRRELVASKSSNDGAHNRESLIKALDQAFDAVGKQIRKANDKKH